MKIIEFVKEHAGIILPLVVLGGIVGIIGTILIKRQTEDDFDVEYEELGDNEIS